ncbi:hypothetical protein FRC03_010802 [Tulasnella sp. 419]|nr:hypothetical protein FRC03_010802 [Tulasnella sp. 419]
MLTNLTQTQRDAEIRSHFVKTVILNSLSLVSVLVFDYVIEPMLDPRHDSWVHKHFSLLYQGFWLLPIITVSLYLNGIWCSAIANRAFALRHGRRAAPTPPYSGLIAHLAASAYRIFLIMSYLALGAILSYIPVIGFILSEIYICWVNSYYCFEYVWIARGMSLAQRVRYLEERWAYFLAYGLPLALVCMWGSGIFNAAVFALLFPAFITMSIMATPQPANSYTSSGALASSLMTPSSPIDGPKIKPNPAIPARLPVFAPVIMLNDAFVQLLAISGGPAARRVSRNSSISGEGEILGAEEGVGVGARYSPAPIVTGGSTLANQPHRVRRRKLD